MTLFKILDYKDIISLTLTFGIAYNANTNYQVDINNYYQNSYKKYEYISFGKENSFETELNTLLTSIELIFECKVKVKDYWIPTKDLLDKVCLFVSFEDQTDLEKKYDDLELSLYEELKYFLEQSEYFEMVALL